MQVDQVTAGSVRAMAAATWGPKRHGRHGRDQRERMRLTGNAGSAMSRKGSNRIRPAESYAPQRPIDSLTGSYLPGRLLPAIGKRAADISLRRCAI